MLKKLLRHIIASGSFQRQFSIIDPTSPPKGKLVNLRENLAVELSNQVRTSSYRHLQKDHRKYEIARFVLIISFLLATMFFSTSLYVLYVGGKAEFFQLTWLQILIISLFFASATFWGWTTLSKLSRDTFDPLHSNGQGIFVKAEMNETWALFCKWAQENKPNIWIIQKDGPANLLEKGFWELSNVGTFILGDNRHRNKLLVDNRKLTSDPMISEHDWEVFQKHHHKQQEQRQKKTIPAAKADDSISEHLSLRQKKHSIGTKSTPRFELLVTHPHFNSRYPEDAKFRQHESNKACHNTLSLILKNEKSRHLFISLASNKGVVENEEQRAFLEAMDKTLNIKLNRHESRRDQILKYKWDKLELYLEDLDIISDAELIEFHPDYQLESDSSL